MIWRTAESPWYRLIFIGVLAAQLILLGILASAFILYPLDPTIAGTVNTALMIAGPGELVRLSRKLGIRCVVLVDDAGTVWMSPAMQKRLQFLTAPLQLRITEDLGGDCGAAAAP